jgi:uncharacterized SAM-binding protein YcdF (DUF218 family)
MFVFLSKFLPAFIYPLGLASILLLLALLTLKRRAMAFGLGFLALALLWLGGSSLVSQALTRSLEWQNLPEGEIEKADAIVVLGGGTEPAAWPRSSVEINGAGDRVLQAARLYRDGKAPVLVLSGGEIEWLNQSTSNPASQMAELLEFLGVPRGAMRLEERSQNTHENAIFSKDILQELDAEKIILVTSALHMPRARALFEKDGFTVIPAPTDFSVVKAENETPDTWQTWLVRMVPTAGNLNGTTNALKEYLGMLIYELRGWL